LHVAADNQEMEAKELDQCTYVPSLEIIRSAQLDYQDAIKKQKELVEEVKTDANDKLIVCSHNPVITSGTSTESAHLLTTPAVLSEQGIQYFKTDRGGGITYHGPEQVLVYPILNLKRHRTDVGWYMRNLEEVVIRMLDHFGVAAIRQAGKTGIWIDNNTKIAFIGVKISRWCTYHGLSVNLVSCSKQFSLINPCGLGKIRVISMADIGLCPPRIEVENQLIAQFLEVFGYKGRLKRH